jgi:hypothetical protein
MNVERPMPSASAACARYRRAARPIRLAERPRVERRSAACRALWLSGYRG